MATVSSLPVTGFMGLPLVIIDETLSYLSYRSHVCASMTCHLLLTACQRPSAGTAKYSGASDLVTSIADLQLRRYSTVHARPSPQHPDLTIEDMKAWSKLPLLNKLIIEDIPARPWLFFSDFISLTSLIVHRRRDMSAYQLCYLPPNLRQLKLHAISFPTHGQQIAHESNTNDDDGGMTNSLGSDSAAVVKEKQTSQLVWPISLTWLDTTVVFDDTLTDDSLVMQSFHQIASTLQYLNIQFYGPLEYLSLVSWAVLPALTRLEHLHCDVTTSLPLLKATTDDAKRLSSSRWSASLKSLGCIADELILYSHEQLSEMLPSLTSLTLTVPTASRATLPCLRLPHLVDLTLIQYQFNNATLTEWLNQLPYQQLTRLCMDHCAYITYPSLTTFTALSEFQWLGQQIHEVGVHRLLDGVHPQLRSLTLPIGGWASRTAGASLSRCCINLTSLDIRRSSCLEDNLDGGSTADGLIDAVCSLKHLCRLYISGIAIRTPHAIQLATHLLASLRYIDMTLPVGPSCYDYNDILTSLYPIRLNGGRIKLRTEGPIRPEDDVDDSDSF
jgi:hypothetical protein